MFLQCRPALPWGSLGEGSVGAGVGEKRREGKKVAEQLCSGWGVGWGCGQGPCRTRCLPAEGALQACSHPVRCVFCWVLVYRSNTGIQACCKMFRPNTKQSRARAIPSCSQSYTLLNSWGVSALTFSLHVYIHKPTGSLITGVLTTLSSHLRLHGS